MEGSKVTFGLTGMIIFKDNLLQGKAHSYIAVGKGQNALYAATSPLYKQLSGIKKTNSVVFFLFDHFHFHCGSAGALPSDPVSWHLIHEPVKLW